MSLRKRKEIQKLLRTAIILSFVSTVTLAGPSIYLHLSPSLPLAQDWIDYVEAYPVLEMGISFELPAMSSFVWRFESAYVPLPDAGSVESGDVLWGGVGIILRKEATSRLALKLGPELMFGRVSAKGTHVYSEGDSLDRLIDFEGDGGGVGIGIIGAALFELTGHIEIGLEAAVVYFGVKGTDIPITSRDPKHPEDPPKSGKLSEYNGEWTAISLRLVAGYSF